MIQVARGRLRKQIAHDIGIAEATVKVHRMRAVQKMADAFPSSAGWPTSSSRCPKCRNAREHYALRDALFAGGSADPSSMASWNPSCAAAYKFRFR